MAWLALLVSRKAWELPSRPGRALAAPEYSAIRPNGSPGPNLKSLSFHAHYLVRKSPNMRAIECEDAKVKSASSIEAVLK